MTTTGSRRSIADQLWEFRRRRLEHEAARKYTVVVDGVEHNAGEYRDNLADVLEELSDAHNILGILAGRLDSIHQDVTLQTVSLKGMIRELMVQVVEVRAALPPSFRRDQAEVLGDKTPKRIVTLAEVGLE